MGLCDPIPLDDSITAEDRIDDVQSVTDAVGAERVDIALVAYGPGPKLPSNGYAGIGLDFAPYWWDPDPSGPPARIRR